MDLAEGLVVRPETITLLDRGQGATTIPYICKWNSESNIITTGTTTFQPGIGLPLHLHNVEESVLVLSGEARATIGETTFDLEVFQAMWVPPGTPHCVTNRGNTPLTIYWVYGGRDVTRTIIATGQTVEHLSPEDRHTSATPTADEGQR